MTSDDNDTTPTGRAIVSGSVPFDPPKRTSAKVSINGGEWEFNDVEIKTQEQVREEAKDLRENAPDRVDLGDRTSDIDAVIEALEEAKERGVDRVLVNDDGRTRDCDPRITNNHCGYFGPGPVPGSLTEWVEL